MLQLLSKCLRHTNTSFEDLLPSGKHVLVCTIRLMYVVRHYQVYQIVW